jgi:DNA-binding response OmpR family regulator
MAHVLIAEDEPNIVESLGFILGRDGHEVVSVADGALALQRVRSQPPDLLILDVMLPRLNGFELLRLLRADVRTQALPVVVLTAKTQAHDRQRAQELGAQAYITKPFANSEVVATVRRLLAGAGGA